MALTLKTSVDEVITMSPLYTKVRQNSFKSCRILKHNLVGEENNYSNDAVIIVSSL